MPAKKAIKKKATPRKTTPAKSSTSEKTTPDKKSPPPGRPPVVKDLPAEMFFNHHQMGGLLAVTENRLRDLVGRSVLIKAGHGKYPVFENVRRYVNVLNLARRDSGQTRSKEIESTRLTKAKADREELLYKELEGSLIRVSDVEIAWAKLLVALRQAFLTLPSQVDYMLREAEPEQRADIIDKAIRKALEVLSDEPEYLVRRDRRQWDESDDPETFEEGLPPESEEAG